MFCQVEGLRVLTDVIRTHEAVHMFSMGRSASHYMEW